MIYFIIIYQEYLINTHAYIYIGSSLTKRMTGNNNRVRIWWYTRKYQKLVSFL